MINAIKIGIFTMGLFLAMRGSSMANYEAVQQQISVDFESLFTESDLIIDGIAKEFKHEQSVGLWKIQVKDLLWSKKKDVYDNSMKWVFIIVELPPTRSTPILIPNKQHILFLQKVNNYSESQIEMSNDLKDKELYKAVKGWQGALCLDNEANQRHHKYIRDNFRLNVEELVESIREICKTMTIRNNKKRVIEYKKLLLEYKENNFYKEILTSLLNKEKE